MVIKDIYQFLDSLSPFELQEKWDNSGLIVGNMDNEFENLYISLDLDLDMIKGIKPNSLIITHHPLIFSPLKKLNDVSYSEKLLKLLIKNDICLISMHTNIDKTHLNDYVGCEILKLPFKKVSDFILSAEVDMSFDDVVEHIKNKLNLKVLKYVKTRDKINSISLTTGSGMSLIDYVKSDLYLTGDIKYHDAMEAKARGISLIDIGHYESEIHFCDILNRELEPYLKINKINAIIPNLNNPFDYK